MKTLPQVTAVVCTRNRGASVVETIKTLLANTYPCFEVLLVDQSTNQDTAENITEFFGAERFRYIRTATRGTGVSRNIGLFEARGDFVAYTDDDCIVPNNWIESIISPFMMEPSLAVVYCRVEPAKHDYTEGYIPAYIFSKDRMLRSLKDTFWGMGMGAGMAVRKDIAKSIGGFDDNLGPGSPLFSGEDHDIAIRALINKYKVLEATTPYVVHKGFRTWEDGKAHVSRDDQAIGATYIKPLRCGHSQALFLILSPVVVGGWFQPLIELIKFKRPKGFRRFYSFVLGCYKASRFPIDRPLLLYLPQKHPLPQTGHQQVSSTNVLENWY